MAAGSDRSEAGRKPQDALRGRAPSHLKQNLPSFSALRAFEAVFRLGSIRSASKALLIDQAVISRHLKSLESWIGTALIERQNNRLYLTERGRAYYAKISQAMSEIALATEEARDNSPDRTAVLSCAPGLALLWLPEQTADFERLHPEFSILLKPAEEITDLALGEADADIRFYVDDWLPSPGGNGLLSIELARPRFLAVASPSFVNEWKPQSLEDVGRLPLLNEVDDDRAWRIWFGKNGLDVPGPLNITRCWNAHISYASAKAGTGVALANSLLVDQFLGDGSLVELFPDNPPVTLGGYFLATRNDRWSRPIIKSLRQFLRQRLSLLPEAKPNQ